MRKFFILTKKELKELITPQLVVPLIVMIFVFVGIGNLLKSETKKTAGPKPIYLINEEEGEAGAGLVAFLRDKNFDIHLETGPAAEALKTVRQANAPGLIVIPAGFTQAVAEHGHPSVTTYRLADDFSLTSITTQSSVDTAIAGIVSYVQSQWLAMDQSPVAFADFQNPLARTEYTVVGEKMAEAPYMAVMNFARQQATFIPIILFVVIIVAAQMVATAIASEKEVKTLETLLSLPIGRKTIVFAKLLAAGLTALLFAAFYMFGFSRYLGGIMGQVGGAGASDAALGPALMSLGISFGPVQYALLGLSLFLGILTALAIALMLGLLVDNVKSVQAVITPLMLLVIVPYLLTMFVNISQAAPALRYVVYAIPFSYSFLAIQKLLIGNYTFVFLGLAYQFLFFLAVVYAVTHLFGTDKVLTMRLGRRKIK